MQLTLFYYTLLLLLACALTSATCLSAYLVTQRRTYFTACLVFLTYFFDVSLVFRDDIIWPRWQSITPMAFEVGTPIISATLGALLLGLIAQGVRDLCFTHRYRYFPCAISCIFLLVSFLSWILTPEGALRLFIFYIWRAIFLAVTLIYGWYSYRYRSSAHHQERASALFAPVFAIVGCCGLIIGENVIFQLLPAIGDPISLPEGWEFFPERNFAENLTALVAAFYCVRHVSRILRLYYNRPPLLSSEPVSRSHTVRAAQVEEYGISHHLSPRQIEVLGLLLQGNDNREIAKTLVLEVSTVKVHVHNILKKTHSEDRQALIRNYWRSV